MIVFVVNCGSSSIKYELFDMTDESVLASGMVDRVGTPEATLRHNGGGRTRQSPVDVPDHAAGLTLVLDVLVDPSVGVLERIDQIDGVGHRVVHGGEDIRSATRIDEGVLEVIRRNIPLAPLHNPPNLAGIQAARRVLPDAPHVAVFDTAFLASLPDTAFRYAVPESWYRDHHVRRYGFHGTSHRYVTARAAELLDKPLDQVNLITAHLGNGCSMTAVAGGRAVDHSMGMTPLEGLMMGTRCGDIDPAVIPYMARAAGMGLDEIGRALNKASGLLGVSGLSNDMRDLLSAEAEGDQAAALALRMFAYRVAKYVGAYHVILPAVDAVVLTGGIGENCVDFRVRLCGYLHRLGGACDDRLNRRTVGGLAGPITPAGSSLPVWVIPTDEELMIARDTRDVVAASGTCH